VKKLTLTCNVTGKQVTYTSEEYIAKRIAKAGSLEELIKTYVCRDANKADKKPTNKSASKYSAREERTWGGKKILKDKEVIAPTPINSKGKIKYVTRDFKFEDSDFVTTVTVPEYIAPNWVSQGLGKYIKE
jgi:hypothetical protein